MSTPNRLRLWWVGQSGTDVTTSLWVTGDASTLITALAEYSGCQIAQARITYAVPGAGSATLGTSPLSAARIYLTTATGKFAITLPGPEPGLYYADAETVNPTGAVGGALIAALVGHCTDNNGNPALAYCRGYRVDVAMPPIDGRMLR